MAIFAPLLLLLSLSATLSSAVPVTPIEYGLSKKPSPPAPITPRCGSTLLPSALYSLQQSLPDTSFPNTALTSNSVFIAQDSIAGTPTNITSLLLTFSPPPSSYGCTLSLTFPSSSPPSIVGTSPTLAVHTVPYPIPALPTWNNVLLNAGLFGTVTVTPGQSSAVNSEVCPAGVGGGLAFVVGYADWITAAGSVSWTEFVNPLDGAGLTGLYLGYDC